MNKTLIVGCFCLLVAGCSKATLTGEELSEAENLCGNHGGVSRIEKRDAFYPLFVCENGVAYQYTVNNLKMTTPRPGEGN